VIVRRSGEGETLEVSHVNNDDLLAHADEAPGTCAEPFEMAAWLRLAAFTQQGFLGFS
jgi:hypothetical protein